MFGRAHFEGFWPPEMGFEMDPGAGDETGVLIPLLKRLGYRYVLVDSEHVEPFELMGWEELRYRPHLAEFDGESIVVIVRDRELSDAQEWDGDFVVRTRGRGAHTLLQLRAIGDHRN